MREILFRGKTKNKHREWIIGLIGKIRNLDDEIEYYITEDPEIENIWLERQIDPSTLGQYTGLTDKNGTKIFEGDIVKHPIGTFVVKFLNGTFCCSLIEDDYLTDLCSIHNQCKVIGNIHDNPEVLGGE